MDFFNSSDNSSNPIEQVSDVASNIGDFFTSSGNDNDIISNMRDSSNNNETMKLFGDIEFTDSGSNNQRDIETRDGQIYAPVDLGNNGVYDNQHSFRTPDEDYRRGDQGIEQRESAQVQQAEEIPGLTQRDISRDPLLRQADRLLRLASGGRDMMRSFQRNANNPNMLDALRAVQDAKPEYSNVKLIDENGDGFLDDARALINTNKGPQEVDVFKTPSDLRNERIQQKTEGAVRRGGEIVLDEVIRGSRRRSETGQSTGGRIFDRMGREGTNGVNRVLRDWIRGR